MGYKKGRIPAWQKPATYNLSQFSLPDKIKCDRCKKWKGTTNYSNRQLDDLRRRLSKLRSAEIADAMTANCRACNGGSVVELQCSKCDKIKGLDDFAKTQRSNGDNAKCKSCMDKQLAMEPATSAVEADYMGAGDEHDLDEESDSDDSDETNRWEPTDEELRLNNLSLQDQQDLVSQNGSTSNYSDAASMATADSGGVSLGEATAKSMLNNKSEWQVKQTRKQQPGPSSAFDTSSSTNAVKSSNYGNSSSTASTYGRNETNGTRSNGWAKAPVSFDIYQKGDSLSMMLIHKQRAPQPQNKYAEESDDDDDLYDSSDDDDDETEWHTKAASDDSSSDGFSDV